MTGRVGPARWRALAVGSASRAGRREGMGPLDPASRSWSSLRRTMGKVVHLVVSRPSPMADVKSGPTPIHGCMVKTGPCSGAERPHRERPFATFAPSPAPPSVARCTRSRTMPLNVIAVIAPMPRSRHGPGASAHRKPSTLRRPTDITWPPHPTLRTRNLSHLPDAGRARSRRFTDQEGDSGTGLPVRRGAAEPVHRRTADAALRNRLDHEHVHAGGLGGA